MNSTPDKPSSPAAPHSTAAPTQDLIGEELITYEVDGDGSRFRMTFNCANGKPGSLSLPTECLHALIMTLPRMMTQALLARYDDDSLRLVYPAREFTGVVAVAGPLVLAQETDGHWIGSLKEGNSRSQQYLGVFD